ncbi:MAG: LemA family protein [Gemmatimonadetes bacterium]|nr:LemA family protein [Gemmatimonadota bacterium]
MGKLLLPVVVLAALAVGVFMWGTSVYNGLVEQEETVTRAWSQVDNQYQRRLELIPNLVATVKGAAEFEKETFTQVAEARANAGKIQMTSEMLSDPEALARFDQAQGALSSALSRLLVTVEKYPDLKANANFVALQDELAGTENRIATERRRFNQTVQAYNTTVRKVPTSLVAAVTGFERKVYFEAREGADEAPKVEF